jgi:hypothetical protein
MSILFNVPLNLVLVNGMRCPLKYLATVDLPEPAAPVNAISLIIYTATKKIK